jgi:hypothetical protein
LWWTQELNNLKDKAITSCKIWKESGRPRQCPIYLKYRQDKLLYTKQIRQERELETTAFANDLHDALKQKRGREFWKCWNSKFGNKACVTQVDGIVDCSVLAIKFAEHFEKICTSPNPDRNEDFMHKYVEIRKTYIGASLKDFEPFDVELLSNLLANMVNGKAAGLDNLSCEHLKFSHPAVIVILCKLFNLFMSLGHIPASFGLSYTVPIPKYDGCTRALTVDDFRGISISPLISKL